MSHRLFTAVVLSLLALSCGGGFGPTSPTPPGLLELGELRGVVLDDAAGTPVAGAVVEAADGRNAGRSTTSDTGGRFSLSLYLGGLTFRVRHAGYEAFSEGVTVIRGVPVEMQVRLRKTR